MRSKQATALPTIPDNIFKKKKFIIEKFTDFLNRLLNIKFHADRDFPESENIMKSVVLYAYPPQPDGLSMQGDMLYRGMKENSEEVLPCHLASDFQKEWIYNHFKPDVAFSIGYWNYTPDVILHPQKFGVTPVPWFVADGWVANYQKEIGSLPLVFVTSEWVKKTYARDGVDTKNFEVAHIGLETEIFKPIPKSDPRIKAVRQMLGVEDNELMIMTAGGDVSSKGAQEILQALKK